MSPMNEDSVPGISSFTLTPFTRKEHRYRLSLCRLPDNTSETAVANDKLYNIVCSDSHTYRVLSGVRKLGIFHACKVNPGFGKEFADTGTIAVQKATLHRSSLGSHNHRSK